MKKGICLGGVPGEDWEAKLQNARQAGFHGVEVNTLRTDADRQEIKELSEKYGITVSSVMNSDHWMYPLSDPDPEVRKKSREGITQSIETGAHLGADTVLVVPGVVNPEVTYEEVMERSVKEIKTILPLAEEKKVSLAIENVWNKFLLSPVEFTAYIDSFRSDYVSAYFDVGNICLYGYPDHWIKTLSKRIKKVHVKGFDTNKFKFVGLMAGTIDWLRVGTALREVGYDDFITAELAPEGPDPLEGLRKISSDLDKILDLSANAQAVMMT